MVVKKHVFLCKHSNFSVLKKSLSVRYLYYEFVDSNNNSTKYNYSTNRKSVYFFLHPCS